MKKLKEFLILFVSFIVLTVLPVVIFVTTPTENAFLSNKQYLRLLLNDDLFLTALFNTYYKMIIFSVFAVLCVALLCRFIKHLKSRKVFYPAGIILASAASVFSMYMDKIRYLGLLAEEYNTQTILMNKPPALSISFSIYDILRALQVGFFVMLLFWLLETFAGFIKTRRSIPN